MRVKSLVAAVGVAVVTTLIVVPGVSNASRGNGTADPVVQPSAEVAVDEETPATPPAEEAPAEPAVEEVPTPPAAEEPAAPPAAEPPAEPVTEKPDAPVVDTPPAGEKPPVTEEPPAEPVTEAPPVAEEPVVVTFQPEAAPAERGKGHAKKNDRAQKAGPCHMDSYEPRQVNGFTPGSGEAARADKVDRNDNGTVCRKDIPGRGRGNTGQGSNIKDDQSK